MFTFATNTQILAFFDWRWLYKNLVDLQQGQQYQDAAAYADISSQTGNLPYNVGATLATLAAAASEELMSAAAVAARYSVSDLQTYGGMQAVEISAALTIARVMGRRIRATPQEKLYGARADWGESQIEALRRGERIFSLVPNVPEAGVPSTTAQWVQGLSPPLLTWQAQRYFGFPAGGRLGPDRGQGQEGVFAG